MSEPRSRAARLHAILGKVAPKASAQHVKDGTWPNAHPNPGGDAETGKALRHSGAPYLLTEVRGAAVVSIQTDEGDVLTGRGATLDDAIAALEAKVGLAEKGAERS